MEILYRTCIAIRTEMFGFFEDNLEKTTTNALIFHRVKYCVMCRNYMSKNRLSLKKKYLKKKRIYFISLHIKYLFLLKSPLSHSLAVWKYIKRSDFLSHINKNTSLTSYFWTRIQVQQHVSLSVSFFFFELHDIALIIYSYVFFSTVINV